MRGLLFGITALALGAAPASAAYSVAASTAYINSWYNTTASPPNGFVTHINSPTYTWYYCDPCQPAKSRVIKTNNGNGTIDTRLGEDCANFGSQILKAGGITGMSGPGVGGTLPSVAKLAAALKSIATETRFRSAGAAPSNLGPGDIVIWNTLHTTEVFGGTGPNVTLSAHSFDTKSGDLAYFFSNIASFYSIAPVARAFHITGSAMTMPATSTPPGVNTHRADNTTIPDGGFTNGQSVSAAVTDSSGRGVDFFEATVGAALYDRPNEVMLGQGADIYLDPTNYATSHTYNVDLSRLTLDGTTVYIQATDGDGNQTIQSFQLDRTVPNSILVTDTADNPINGATSSTTIKVTGSDALSGAYTINVNNGGSYNQTSTNTTPSPNVPYSNTFTSLTDGSYTATVVDLAGNSASANFIISSGNPNANTEDDKGGSITNVIASSRCIVVHATDASAGIASISITGDGLSKTMNFRCGVPARSTDVYAGSFCNLTENSTYTYITTSCSGKSKISSEISIATSTKGGSICVAAPAGTFCGTTGTLSDAQLLTWGTRMRVCMSSLCGLCAGGTGEKNITTLPTGGSPYCDTGPTCCRMVEWGAPLSNKAFSVSNTTDVASNLSGNYEFSIFDPGTEGQVSLANLVSPNFKMNPGQSTAGTIDVSQIGQGYPKLSSDGVAKANVPFTHLNFFLQALADYILNLSRQLLRASSSVGYALRGSDAIFNSTTTLTFTYVDAVNTDTTTVRIYMFDDVSWSSAGITNQAIAYSTTTHIITASGSVDRTGLYATLYQAVDSSAPITTLTIQGTSFFFDGALFVSTDTYLVLTATDPVVNGFASTVASMTYRIDPVSGTAFSIYTTSIPVQLGTHIIEYRSVDYAGNIETVKTATFTATAGTAMRTSNTAQIPGTFLNGFLGSGAKLEIESQAQNSLTLLISSVNRQGMVAVDNIGEVGIGVTPQANLNIGQGSIALQLRSGNSTSSVTSNQITFGYNGDYSMRHLLRTEHSTSTDGNKMDFLVWNTGAGSTTTLASLKVLSLQGIATASGGSFHVQPVGEPDVEVEVSNGLSTGGGTMQRLQVLMPSSRRFKTDIRDLSAKDEDRALSDVVGLKHARYRYKSRAKDGRLIDEPTQALRTGLIYEDAPESIRDGADALSTTERLVNVEMALKASMRRLEELQARYEKLKTRRKP